MTHLEAIDGAALQAEIDRLRVELDQCHRAAREIDHRAANSLQIAASAMRLQRKLVTDAEARTILDEASLRFNAIAHAHRHFYAHATDDEVDLAAILADLARDLSTGMHIACRSEVTPSRIPGQSATHVVILVNELVVNAHKHAHDDDDDGRVSVLIHGGRKADGSLRLVVTDDGRGLPAGFEIGNTTGLGMRFVNASVERLGGAMLAWTDGGAHFALTIPAVATPRSQAPAAPPP